MSNALQRMRHEPGPTRRKLGSYGDSGPDLYLISASLKPEVPTYFPIHNIQTVTQRI